jgi:hypothetical protein
MIRMTGLAALLLGATIAVAGCATGGRTASPGAGAAAFVAPDGAKATPNTGASRLADGLPAGVDATAAGDSGGRTPATPSAAGPVAAADGVAFTWSEGGSSVNLAGDFNAWSADADPMVKQADGSFRLVKKLEPGRYAYKFVVDGQWQPDPQAAESVDDGFGGKNSVIVIGPAAAGAGATSASTPTAGAAPAGATGQARAPEITAEGVRFTFAGAARSVHLAGDFNGWSPTTDPLVRGADGAWTIVRRLPAGSHAYKFVVDGTTWKSDEANPSSVDDGFGGKNSLVTVP